MFSCFLCCGVFVFALYDALRCLLQIRVKFPDRRTPERLRKSNLRLAAKAGSKVKSGGLCFSQITYGKTEVVCNIDETQAEPVEEVPREPAEEAEVQEPVEKAEVQEPVEEAETEPAEDATKSYVILSSCIYVSLLMSKIMSSCFHASLLMQKA